MSSISAPPNLGQAAPAAPANPVASVVNPPPNLSALAPGSIVQGTVSGRDNHGMLLVKTDVGNIVLQTAQPLPPGSKVQLEIQAQGSQLQVVILHSERPPSAAAAIATQLVAQAAPGGPAHGGLAQEGSAVTTQGLGANLSQALADRGLPPSVGAALAATQLATEDAALRPIALAPGTMTTALLVQAGATPLPTQLAGGAYGSPQIAQQIAQQVAALASSLATGAPIVSGSVLTPFAAGAQVPGNMALGNMALGNLAAGAQPAAAGTGPTAAPASQPQTPAQLQAVLAQSQGQASAAAQSQAQTRVQVTPAAVLMAAQTAAAPATGAAPAVPNAANLQTSAPNVAGATPAASVAAQTTQAVQAAAASLGGQHAGQGTGQGGAGLGVVPGQAAPGAGAGQPGFAQPAGAAAVAVSGAAASPGAPTLGSTQSGLAQSGLAAPGSAATGQAQPLAANMAPGTGTLTGMPNSGALSVRVLAFAPPAAGGAAATSGAPTGITPPGTAPTGTAPTASAIIPPGSTPTGSTPLGISPTGNAPVLTGTVLFSTPQGQPVVQTGAGVLTLNVRADLPVGSTVSLEVLGEAPMPATAAPVQSSGSAASLVSLSRQWPSLDETLTTLQQIDPQLAQTVMRTILPQPGPHFTGGLLFFMSALKGGEVRSWLGEPAVRALEGAGKGRLINKLNDEFRELGRGSEAQPGEWRGYFLPVHDGQYIQQVRLFVHRHGEDGEGTEGDAEGTRFMVDVEMTRLGPVQIDGLVREKRLDLVVRTREALPEEMRREINGLFVSAGETTGFKGGLTFQAGPKMPPPPLEQVVGHRPDVVV